ncbi:Uncharacterised protein [Vibrio cholerae]|nr:Uncharacterised protein [Vibrio cholerae]CSI46962.1 Uncharacterised protein [Vibrio cholerae]
MLIIIERSAELSQQVIKREPVMGRFGFRQPVTTVMNRMHQKWCFE